MSVRDVVVVGGSTAGATAMRDLRRRGYEGPITLVDPSDGTNRPPLSKAVLRGDAADDSVLMDHSALDVTHVRAAAAGLDSQTQAVRTADGSEYRYDALVLATGSRARRLARPGQSGELVLRTLEDAQALRAALASVSTAVVIGGGFLGLEIATAAAKAGLSVSVVDPDPPLLRHLGPHLAEAIGRRVRDAGIAVHRSTAELVGDPVSAVLLGDGSRLEAEVVISCIGDDPVVDWLAGTDVHEPSGVLIDHEARTSAPGVWAAGDIARVRRGSGSVRAPFWANAVTQGRVVAASILGQEVEDPVVDPYFWTEVAGVSLKAVGPLPVDGAPRTLEDAGDGAGVFAWDAGPSVVALGVRRAVPRLRALCAELAGT